MYADVSKDFVVETEKPSRKFEARIKINGKWYTDIKSLSIISGSCDEDNITIGSAVSSYIEVTMSDIGELFENTEIELQYGIVISDGSIEYIPMGYFTVQRPEDDNGYVKFTAYDRMAKLEKMYTSKLTYPATAIQVIDEICSQCGIIRETIGLGTVYVQTKPEGYTCREVIGYMASLFGKFAVIGRNGKLQIRFYEDSGYNVQMCRTFSLKKNQSDYAVGFLTCNTNSSTQLTAGSGSRGIVFDNPFITQERLEELYQVLEGFTYRPATIKFLGNIRIDVWDLITTTDLTGNVYKIPVMKITQKFDGGVVTTIEASGKTEEEINTDFKGPVTKGLERTYTELLLANTIIATKVDAEWVKANTVTADKIEAVNADIANIHANMLTTNEADIKYATITSLEAEKARITVLEAGSADIGILKTQVADINTLMFGTASGGSLTTEFSNSVVSLIGDAQIKSAMIKDITADKIISGKLYTNLVEVCSQSGNLDIADNTIMIKDNAEVVRVQLGKDASGDYNMYIWDKSGKLMFDALGLTESGIKREIIRNDMISETANISAKKLDINSLFTEINGSTETIKANRIYVDADNQTLDVAFKTMSTSVTTATNKADSVYSLAESANTNASSALAQVNTIAETVSSQGTQLTTVQGQISSKIWQQDITTAVTELEIGGRNYLLSSSVEKTAESPNGRYTSIDYTSVIPEKMQVATETKQYTLTIWLTPKEGKNAFTSVVFGGVNGGDGWAVRTNCSKFKAEDIQGTNIKKYKYTLNLMKGWYLQSFIKILFERTSVDNAGCTVHKIKLEKGSKATDWTPAPEDVDSSLTTLEGTTTTLANQYTEINQTLSGLSAEVAANKTTIATKADGSTVTTLQSDVTKIKADLNGFESEVSSIYSTKAELSNLQIGGSNLLLGTLTQDTSKGNYRQLATETEETFKGCKVFKTNKQYADIGFDFKTQIRDRNVIIPGDWVTYSIYAKTDDTNLTGFPKVFLQGKTSNYVYDKTPMNNTNLLNSSWQQYSYTIQITEEMLGNENYGTYWRFEVIVNCTAGKYIYWAAPKLEIGKKATDYTPATDDLATTEIMKSSIKQAKDDIEESVSYTYATQDSLGDYETTKSVEARLSLKIDKTDNSQIVSMINASADIIRLTADRFILDSTYSKINQDGIVKFTGGEIGGFTIDGNGLFNVQNGVGCGMQKFGLGSAFWAGPGGVGNGGTSAEFKVWHDGSVFAQKMHITGGSLNINDNLIIDASGNLTAKGSADFQCSTVYANDFHSRGSLYAEYNLDVGGTIGCNTLQVKNNMYVYNTLYYWYDGAWVTLRDYISAIINGG